jgi:hypothetical protein
MLDAVAAIATFAGLLRHCIPRKNVITSEARAAIQLYWHLLIVASYE